MAALTVNKHGDHYRMTDDGWCITIRYEDWAGGWHWHITDVITHQGGQHAGGWMPTLDEASDVAEAALEQVRVKAAQ